jgi:hypothetical protein
MTKVNIEGFVEVECPVYNKERIDRGKLDKSLGLKIQIFLDSVPESLEGHGVACTKIVCPSYSSERGCMVYRDEQPCLYSELAIKDK